jgi:hypothetical protein
VPRAVVAMPRDRCPARRAVLLGPAAARPVLPGEHVVDATLNRERQRARPLLWLAGVAVPWVLGLKLRLVNDPQGVAAVVSDGHRDRMARCADVARHALRFQSTSANLL